MKRKAGLTHREIRGRNAKKQKKTKSTDIKSVDLVFLAINRPETVFENQPSMDRVASIISFTPSEILSYSCIRRFI